MDGEREVKPLLDTESYEGAAAVSPDGRWIAYQSNMVGHPEVPGRFSSNTSRTSANVIGSPSMIANLPQWSPDGRELYFLGAGPDAELFAVPIEVEPRFEAGAPRVLLEGSYHHRWGAAAALRRRAGWAPLRHRPDGRVGPEEPLSIP